MKMVMNGYAAGGCITMGGYDYHTGDRRRLAKTATCVRVAVSVPALNMHV